MTTAKVYLIPSLLGTSPHQRVLPDYNIKVIESINTFVVENEKSARKFIKQVCPEKVQADLEIYILDKDTNAKDLFDIIKLLDQGKTIGIISEAGLPAVADPGAQLVKVAQEKRIQVVPLVGPSSILMALMASGMNGQNFAFHGYLPIDKTDRKKRLSQLEAESSKTGIAQIFMETPYRNNQMIDDLVKLLHGETRICVACDITLESEDIRTRSIKEWKNEKYDFHKRPAIFVMQAN
ncbi:SAM-dependent methyltransferase [Faecalibacter rhinopitheci]|uniref:SAM-dependent methyltransferase n=1 Tax=Faecalibacter rhinopitheci TaxID=2779678 RepID=A0A8J7G414_9FLAO|nr:SAM-dependent methyltransferase [Faecalibacter rhinopitheci]MBF0596252.1 SAM-dependent methyltransferase [Faecalibacter rhinopitheci]